LRSAIGFSPGVFLEKSRLLLYRILNGVKRAAFFFLILLIYPLLGSRAFAEDPLGWINRTRASHGLSALVRDPVAMRTAEEYAALLAGLGRISHTGPDGADALTRYFRAGGTSALVGEILGAGPGLPEVEAAWLASPSHKGSILKPYWTHAGWASARSGNAEVWVVLFTRVMVRDLVIDETGEGGRIVSGSFIPGEAAGAALLCGVRVLEPTAWDPAKRSFSFRAGADVDFGYVRLGYLTREGELVITDVITSPRGRGSPRD
jgi:hypothetical protein